MNKSETSISFVLNITVSFLLASVPFVIYKIGESQVGDEKLFFKSIFFWYLGVIFLLSPRYAKKNHLFYLIDFACRKTAAVGSDYRSKIYGAVFCLVGAGYQWQWLTSG